MSNKSSDALGALVQQIEEQSAPLDTWTPKNCGEINIRIPSDGTWYHGGSAIKRDKLVRLFAKVLCKEQGQYYLKTPVEKMAITVDDAPLLIVDWRLEPEPQGSVSPWLICTDNVGREFVVSEQHPLVVHEDAQGQSVPYLVLPYGVEAKVARSVFYAWAQELVETTPQGFQIHSAGVSFSLT